MTTRAPLAEIEMLGLAALGLGFLWFVTKGPQAATQTIVRAAGDVATGAVIGAGQVIGIPPTDEAKCAAAIADGRWWDASFDCPAGTFIKGVWNGPPASSVPGATPPFVQDTWNTGIP